MALQESADSLEHQLREAKGAVKSAKDAVKGAHSTGVDAQSELLAQLQEAKAETLRGLDREGGHMAKLAAAAEQVLAAGAEAAELRQKLAAVSAAAAVAKAHATLAAQAAAQAATVQAAAAQAAAVRTAVQAAVEAAAQAQAAAPQPAALMPVPLARSARSELDPAEALSELPKQLQTAPKDELAERERQSERQSERQEVAELAAKLSRTEAELAAASAQLAAATGTEAQWRSVNAGLVSEVALQIAGAAARSAQATRQMMHQQVAAVSQSAEDTAGAVAGQIAGAAAANAHQLLHKQLGEKERRVAELEVKLAAAEAELEAAVRPTAARATATVATADVASTALGSGVAVGVEVETAARFAAEIAGAAAATVVSRHLSSLVPASSASPGSEAMRSTGDDRSMSPATDVYGRVFRRPEATMQSVDQETDLELQIALGEALADNDRKVTELTGRLQVAEARAEVDMMAAIIAGAAARAAQVQRAAVRAGIPSGGSIRGGTVSETDLIAAQIAGAAARSVRLDQER